MTLEDCRNAIRDAIKAKRAELYVYPHVETIVNTPCLIITPSTDVEIPSAEYFGTTMGGATKWYFDLIYLTNFTDMKQAIPKIDRAVSKDIEEGIPWIVSLKNSPALKETFSKIQVVKMREYSGRYVVGSTQYIGACLKVEAEEKCGA